MSGEKHLWVSQAEYRRLQQAAEKLRTVDANLPTMIEGIRAQTRNEFRAGLAAVEERQRQIDRAVGGMSDQVRHLEQQTSERLRRQAQELEAAMAASEARTHRGLEETRRQLAEQGQLLQRQIAEERMARERDVAEVQAQISQMLVQRGSAEALAHSLVGDAEMLYQTIDDSMPTHEVQGPERLPGLSARLRTARGTIDAGMYEAAVANAQEILHGLLELQADIQLRDMAWHAAQSRASEALRIVLGLIDENRMRRPVDAAGEIIEDQAVEDLDVNRWTDGRLAELEKQVSDLLLAVQDSEAPLSTSELRRVVEEQAPRFKEQLDDLLVTAGFNMLSHHKRASIAEIIAQTLVAAHYKIDQYGFVSDDDRNDFAAKLSTDDGQQVVILVGNDRIDLHSIDAEPLSERQRVERAQGLAKALAEQGIEIDAVAEERAPAGPDLRDLTPILLPNQTVRPGRAPAISRPGPVENLLAAPRNTT